MNTNRLIVASLIVLLLAVASAYVIGTKQQASWASETAELRSGLEGLRTELTLAQKDLASLRADAEGREAEAQSLKAQLLYMEEELAKAKKKAEEMPFAHGMAFNDKGAAPIIPKLLKDVMALGKDAEAGADGENAVIELPDVAKLEELAARELGKDEGAAEKHEEILKRVREKAGPEVADMVEQALKEARKQRGKTSHRVFRLPGGGEGHVVIQMDGMELGGGGAPPPKAPPVKEDF